MKILTDNRNLLLGLMFVIGTLLVWTYAREVYRERLAGVQSEGKVFNVTLKEVTQFRALFPDRSVEQWLGAEKADKARKQLKRFEWAFAAALVCGFFAVFCLGLRLDALRADCFRSPTDGHHTEGPAVGSDEVGRV